MLNLLYRETARTSAESKTCDYNHKLQINEMYLLLPHMHHGSFLFVALLLNLFNSNEACL